MSFSSNAGSDSENRDVANVVSWIEFFFLGVLRMNKLDFHFDQHLLRCDHILIRKKNNPMNIEISNLAAVLDHFLAYFHGRILAEGALLNYPHYNLGWELSHIYQISCPRQGGGGGSLPL